MAEVVLYRDEQGKLAGLGEKGARQWSRFRKHVDAMGPGETLEFSWEKPRCPVHHRAFFALLSGLFDRQEQFDTVDKLRAWVTVGAGYCDFVPGPSGRMVALPQSIKFAKLDETEFTELHLAVVAFLRTEHAQRLLWPMATTLQADQCMEDLLSSFEKNR